MQWDTETCVILNLFTMNWARYIHKNALKYTVHYYYNYYTVVNLVEHASPPVETSFYAHMHACPGVYFLKVILDLAFSI